MKKLMNILMLSCRKAAGLIDKKQSFGLNPIERMQLFFHTSMCDACRNYQKQSILLDTLLSKRLSEFNPSNISVDVETLKKKFINALPKK